MHVKMSMVYAKFSLLNRNKFNKHKKYGPTLINVIRIEIQNVDNR